MHPIHIGRCMVKSVLHHRKDNLLKVSSCILQSKCILHGTRPKRAADGGPSTSQSGSYDPYKILNIDSGSSIEDVRNAFIKLSKKFHPDFNPGDEKSNEKFVLITNAYRHIMERLEKEENNDEDIRKKKYDFTISPLGIETEPQPVVKSLFSMKKILVFLAIFLGIQYFKDYHETDFKEKLKSYIWKEKTEEQYEAEMSKKLREAIIKEHKEKQSIDESLHRIKEVMYGSRHS